ncbi:MAG: 2-oxo acid dehydrogenase subunit E2 [Actinomycetia bacterium]|nr:2-oxo acid dehydrogenase subunit E2 [Actinomycetes bacterium]
MSNDLKFCLPDLGEGLTEGEVLRWLVAAGDTVAINQPLVEVETAKAAVELPSPYSGTVVALHAAEGDLLPVGAPLVTIASDVDTDGESGISPSDSVSAESEPHEGTGPLLVGYGVTESATRRRRRVGAPSPHGTERPEAGPPGEPVKPVRHGGLEVGRAAEAKFADIDASAVTARAKPPVRRLAKQLGIDLADVRPTGRDGTVTRDDVEAAAALQLAGKTSDGAARTVDGDRREPVRGVMRSMAAAMTESAATIPSVTEWVEVDVTRSAGLVDRMKGLPEYADTKVTPLLLVAAACLTALHREQRINAVFDAVAQEIVYRGAVQLGVAVASDRGLVVPHVGDAAALTLHELAVALADVVSRARSGTATPTDLVGGTFTITNVGVFGVDGGTPMITPGQSAILAFGAWRQKPWVEGDQLVVRTTSTLSLSFDHRFIDGATGSRFLRDVADILEEPALLHLWT